MSLSQQVRGPLASPTAERFSATEAIERFPCFGGRCAVLVTGFGPAGNPRKAAVQVKRRLRAWHEQFSRFKPESELSRMNRDPRASVPVSSAMTRFVEAALNAPAMTEGLVDPTPVEEIDRAGYGAHFDSIPVLLRQALGVVQVTALAPSEVQAKSLSKAAVLSGRDGAQARLTHGGVVVFYDETFDVIDPTGVGQGEIS